MSSKKNKKTGLANFSPSKAVPLASVGEQAPQPDSPAERESETKQTATKNNKPRIKQFPVRITVDQWRHLKELAAFEEKSLVQITIEGYNMLLKSKGLKSLDEL